MAPVAIEIPQEVLDLHVEPTRAERRARRLLELWNRASTHYANRTTPHRLARAIRIGQVAWPACREAGIPLSIRVEGE